MLKSHVPEFEIFSKLPRTFASCKPSSIWANTWKWNRRAAGKRGAKRFSSACVIDDWHGINQEFDRPSNSRFIWAKWGFWCNEWQTHVTCHWLPQAAIDVRQLTEECGRTRGRGTRHSVYGRVTESQQLTVFRLHCRSNLWPLNWTLLDAVYYLTSEFMIQVNIAIITKPFW